MKKTGKTKIKKSLLFIILIILVVVVNFPIIFMVINSFKPLDEIMGSTKLLPESPGFENYIHVLNNTPMLHFIYNSFIIAAGGTFCAVVVASTTGYVLSRYKNRFTGAYGQFLLVLQIFPMIVVLIPLFIFFTKLNLVNTKRAMIIMYTTTCLPYSVMMFRAYFEAVSRDLEEAAWIDGCSRVMTFLRVVMPVSAPGIAAVTIFAFVHCWNEYMIASLFLKGTYSRTITVGIQMFVAEFSSQWGYMFASATLAMIPIFVLFFFFQKYMIAGYTAGSTKG
jgi:ABC-type glycerol-3-phosphate transport system permease component